MFSRWGEFAYQHRRVIPLVVVAVIILLYLTFGMRLSDRMSQEGWDDPQLRLHDRRRHRSANIRP